MDYPLPFALFQVAGTTATNPDGSGVLCENDVAGQTQYIFHIIALALREVRPCRIRFHNQICPTSVATRVARSSGGGGSVMPSHLPVSLESLDPHQLRPLPRLLLAFVDTNVRGNADGRTPNKAPICPLAPGPKGNTSCSA